MEEAANLFQTHSFKKALQLYDQCITMCKKNSEPKGLLHNLMSSKGALLSITGDQKAALKCLNQVLVADPYHSLCLMRRSQVLKKKGKMSKALKDIQILEKFSPDNMQIAALKVEIQNLRMKSKNGASSSSESQEDQSEQSISYDDYDEEEELNFSNLKMIDRKSASIMFPAKSQVGRKSQVTIAGDVAVEYEAIEYDDEKKSQAETNITQEYAKEKYVKTFKEIELDDAEQTSDPTEQVPIIKIKTNTNIGRSKSILKNRESTIYISNQKFIDIDKKYGGRESKMINVLKNIDGKVIPGTSFSLKGESQGSIKQVGFRKSIFGGNSPIQLSVNTTTKSENKPKVARKSCMKRTSFDTASLLDPIAAKGSQPRRSKFDMMPKMGIDGSVIKSKRKSTFNEGAKQNVPVQESNSDSDEGSSHNIFGNSQIVLSKEIRENLGLGQDNGESKKPAANKPRMQGGKSILKSKSVFYPVVGAGDKKQVSEGTSFKEAKKPKKSVMFTRKNE